MSDEVRQASRDLSEQWREFAKHCGGRTIYEKILCKACVAVRDKVGQSPGMTRDDFHRWAAICCEEGQNFFVAWDVARSTWVELMKSGRPATAGDFLGSLAPD